MTAVRPSSTPRPVGALRCARCGAPIPAGQECTACAVRRPVAVPQPRRAVEYTDPPTRPVMLPAAVPAPTRTPLGLWVLAGVLAVLLVVGILALVRPDLFGLPSAPLIGGTGDPAPGSAATG